MFYLLDTSYMNDFFIWDSTGGSQCASYLQRAFE